MFKLTNMFMETVKKILALGRRKASEREIIINVEKLETRVALLEKNQLEELSIERTNEERIVGSIFKGKIKNHEMGLKAAFVDIGMEKNAFLHHWDMLPAALDDELDLVDRGGRKKPRKNINVKDIPSMYPAGSDVMIQVTKGPISTKGPRVTTNISLPGRFLVLMPFNDQCGISRKVEDTVERKRLRKILEKLTIPDNMGVIIRTAGVGQKERYFIRDLALLVEKWNEVERKMKSQHSATSLYQEPDLVERTVRDFLTEDIDRIYIDNQEEANRINDLIAQISRRSKSKIKVHNESVPIFEKFGVEKQIENAFRRQVWLKSGGYIVIDETEALVAIDVNTGRAKATKEQDKTILQTNVDAAEEICRQLRLRNIGGIIVLDFIDMKLMENKKRLADEMEGFMLTDRAKHAVLPISKFGLMQVTRQRMKPEMNINTSEICPGCHGTGKISSTLILEDEIEKNLSYLIMQKHRGLTIMVNPILHSYLTKGLISKRRKWNWKYKQSIKLVANSNYQLTEFHFFDEKDEEIKL